MNYELAEQRALLMAETLDRVAAIAQEQLGLPEEARKLQARAQQVRDDRFRVLVVGEFKRGKSTLLNALLGDDILPRKVAECTAVVTLIQYGEQPGVRVIFDDGRPDENLSVTEFRARYELTLEDADDREAAADRFSHVDHAVVSYPVELCRHRIELVDSPGLGAHRIRSQRTQRFLSQSDAIVFVLYAPQFLKEDESHFLEAILLPLGLRNIFFVVNGWNLIDEAVIRPEDAEREKQELEGHIRLRLTPFCVLDGKDHSAERIFRVNALGALKSRMRRPPSQAMLQESNVLPFEESLQRFLVEDRGRVRAEAVLGILRATFDETNRFIATQLSLAGRSIAEIEAERVAMQPKLERLRGIRQHIAGFLDSQSANLQDRLVLSFEKYIERIDAELPQAVEKFDLQQVTSGLMVWKAMTDKLRSEENKFARKVERHVKPQVQRFLEERFAVWQQSVLRNEMQAVKIDVDKYLQEEAAEYLRVVHDIEAQLGIHGSPLQIQELVQRWLSPGSGETSSKFDLSGIGAVVDVAPLLAGIVADVVLHAAVSATLLWLAPLVGLVISAVRLAWRESQLRDEIRLKIHEAIRDGLQSTARSETIVIRNRIKDAFNALKERIVGNIDAEIAIIDGSLQAIIDRKKHKEYSAAQERERLEAARLAFGDSLATLRSALRISTN
jgi:hypothetical protein